MAIKTLFNSHLIHGTVVDKETYNRVRWQGVSVRSIPSDILKYYQVFNSVDVNLDEDNNDSTVNRVNQKQKHMQ